jgi:hypothetical protein
VVAHWHNSHWIGQDTSGSINSPTLAVADQGDGTGATATVSGSTAGTTNTIYTSSFSGATGSGSWTNSGNRVGNGTVDLSLSVGHYFAYCDSTNGSLSEVSGPVYFVVTSTTQSIYYQILAGVQSRLQAISLADIPNGQIGLCKLPLILHTKQQSIDMPCVLVAPTRDVMPGGDGVTTLDDVTYGVHVVAVDTDNRSTSIDTDMKKYLLWREQIARAFRSQRLSGVDEVVTCTCEPMDVTDLPKWIAEYQSCGFILKFTSREPRGL